MPKMLLPNPGWFHKNKVYSGLYHALNNYPEAFAHIPQDRKRLKRTTGEQAVILAEKLAKENGGRIPSDRLLTAQGYGRLCQRIRKCPELFSHLEKDSEGGHSDKEAFALAKKLAKQNGGSIPSGGTLDAGGYNWLRQRICKKPELFSSLEQDCTFVKDNEAVAIAKKLAKKNGGTLPCQKSLTNTGYGWLAQRIWKKPKLFNQIEQEYKGGLTDKEMVSLAETLAKKNKGRIPNSKWLSRHKYYGLRKRIIDRPHLFKHLEMENKRGSTDLEAVKEAEILAAKHGGVLPNRKWLSRNGFNGLSQRIYAKPELFTHLKIEYKGGQSEQEAVQLAEKLANDNGGKIPSCRWLNLNGHNNLSQRLYKRPELFAHLERERCDSKGRVIA